MYPPAPARPRRTGLLAHLVWEAVLLALTIIAGAAVVLGTVLDLQFTSPIWSYVATIGILATGFALSVRTATPNLAVGGLATLSGVILAKLVEGDWPMLAAAAVAVLVVAVIGVGMGLVVGLTSAPAWVVSLGTLAAVQAAALALADFVTIPLRGEPPSGPWIVLVAAAFATVSIIGGIVWLNPVVQDRLGFARGPVDPVRFQPGRMAGALVGLGGSSVLAAVSGVVTVILYRAAFAGDTGALFPAIGAVLLGGVSVFGRRGGVTGTVFGVLLLALAVNACVVLGWPRAVISAVPAAAILVGLVVSRVLEGFAGPEPFGPGSSVPAVPAGVPAPPGPAPAFAAPPPPGTAGAATSWPAEPGHSAPEATPAQAGPGAWAAADQPAQDRPPAQPGAAPWVPPDAPRSQP